MKLRAVTASLILALCTRLGLANADNHIGGPVPVYTEAELINLIEKNKHLERVKADSCQLVEDILARATRISPPAYEFLYGQLPGWGN